MTREEASEDIFVRAMVGDQMNIEGSVYFSRGATFATAGDVNASPSLELRNCDLKTKEGISRLSGINFSIRQGEIFGVAGVAGNGQRELAECVTGVVQPSSGGIYMDGREVTSKPTTELLKGDIGYIPEDRLHDGFLPKANVAQNLILGHHRQQPLPLLDIHTF